MLTYKSEDPPPVVSRAPVFGIYEPLLLDALGPLDVPTGETQKLQYAEVLYSEMKELCEMGCLCIYQVNHFEDLMKQEKRALKKALPGRERLLRVTAYNRVVT